jgi:methyl-accepting chemotaxis protein
MAKQVTLYQVFIASPNDVSEERAISEEVIQELNLTIALNANIKLELVKWETHAYPSMGIDGQDVINRQIDDEYDIFIGIMWKRFGSKTGRAPSGTVEEFERAYSKYIANPDSVNIMFYFSSKQISIYEIDIEQIKLIKDFQQKLEKLGSLYWGYQDMNEFRKLLRIHLNKVVHELINKQKPNVIGQKDLPEIIDIEEVKESEEDGGLLDYIILGEDNMNEAVLTLNRMSKIVEDIGETLNARTEHINSLITSKTTISNQEKLRVIELAASDLFNFASRLNTEIPIFQKYFNKGVESFTKSMEYYEDVEQIDEAGLINTLEKIQDYKSRISITIGQIMGFRKTLNTFPRISKKLNTAKRKSVETVERLINALKSTANIISELESATEVVIYKDDNTSSI